MKGYGLSLFVDIFAGLLSGSAYGGRVIQLSNMDHDSGNGHLFVLINAEKFLTLNELEEAVGNLEEKIKQCGEDGKVFLPGELGNLKMQAHENYIELSSKQIEEINNIAASCGAILRLEVLL